MNENEAPMVDPTPNTPSTGEGIAESYVHTELKKAKDSLLRTQILSALAVVLLGGYTIYATNGFRRAMEPKEAATIARGLVSQRLTEGGPQFADYVKREVPALLRQAPDYALKELPNIRTQVEERVNTDVERYAKASAEQLGGEVDKFLENNKESVGQLLKDGQDPAATAKINGELKAVFVRYLDEPAGGGESMKAKLDEALKMLRQVEGRMKRLATAKDLTPKEQNAKRAIAVLMKTVTQKRLAEGHLDAPGPKAVREAGQRVRGAVEQASANRPQ